MRSWHGSRNTRFLIGTVVPGAVLVLLFLWWATTGHAMGWSTATDPAVSHVVNGAAGPRLLPLLAGLGSLAFLGNIMLLFAGVEVQSVHVGEMKNPRRGFPAAMLLASIISVAVFLLGSLAVAAPRAIQQARHPDRCVRGAEAVLVDQWHLGWVVQVLAASSRSARSAEHSPGFRRPAEDSSRLHHDGLLPPLMQKTNKQGAPRNILIIQAIIVTAVSSIYLFTANVSGAFFLISTVTISLYIVMYMLMYAAAIRLRYSQPKLARAFRIPVASRECGSSQGSASWPWPLRCWCRSFPPTQLPVETRHLRGARRGRTGSSSSSAALMIYRFRKPSWRAHAEGHSADEASFTAKQPQ